MRVTIGSYTDAGPYQQNEDACGYRFLGADGVVGAIADGVGGATFGKEAAEFAVEKFLATLETDPTVDQVEVVRGIHHELLHGAAMSPPPGDRLTTFSTCYVADYRLRGVHVGDTRICILRGNGIQQITRDHTELARLVQAGKLSADDAAVYPRKHIIESALGMAATPRVDTIEFDLQPHDRVLLTTDGVHNLLTKKVLRDISVTTPTVDAMVQVIANAVHKIGALDNLTIMLLEIR